MTYAQVCGMYDNVVPFLQHYGIVKCVGRKYGHILNGEMGDSKNDQVLIAIKSNNIISMAHANIKSDRIIIQRQEQWANLFGCQVTEEEMRVHFNNISKN